MKIIEILKSILMVLSIVFIFIDWRVSITMFFLVSIIHVIPRGPDALLSVITGNLFIGGIVYFFIDWRIAILLILCSGSVARFRLWGNKVNYEYYNSKGRHKE